MNKFTLKKIIAIIVMITLLPWDSYIGCFPLRVQAEELGDSVQMVSDNNMKAEDVSVMDEEAAVSDGDASVRIPMFSTGAPRLSSSSDTGFMLTEDMEIEGEFVLTDGEINLNGYTLTIKGDFLQAGGVVNVAGGQFVVEGDYRIQSRSGQEDENIYGPSTGQLKMVDAGDYVMVMGSYLSDGSVDTTGYLTAGTLEVKGDVVVNNAYSSKAFVGTGSHKLLLSGEGLQNINIMGSSESASQVSSLEITNASEEGVVWAKVLCATGVVSDHKNKVSGTLSITGSTSFSDNYYGGNVYVGVSCTLSEEMNIGGDVSIGAIITIVNTMTVGGNLSIDRNVTISGKVYVKGNFYQNEWCEMVMKRGWLEIEGDYVSNKNDKYTSLHMYYAEDYIYVHGNMDYHPHYNSILSIGTIEVGGDFTSSRHLTATNSHRFVFSGDSRQQIDIAPSCYFATVELQNYSEEGVYATTMFNKNELIRNGCRLTYEGYTGELGWTLTEDTVYEGDLVLLEDALDLNGHSLTITGNLIQLSGTVMPNGGKLIIEGDYRIQSRTGDTGAYTYGMSSGRLQMTNDKDYVLVKGSYLSDTLADTYGYLTAGVLEVKKDVTVNNIYSWTSFVGSGNHKLLLSGEGLQNVDIKGSSAYASRVSGLEITNTSEQGVVLVSHLCATGVINDHKNKVSGTVDITGNTSFIDNYFGGSVYIGQEMTLSKEMNIIGDVSIAAYTTFVNTMMIGGNLYIEAPVAKVGNIYVKGNCIQNNCRMYLDGGRIEIEGNYSINGSSAYLQMTHEKDYIYVHGDVSFNPGYVSTDFLTNGTIEVGGDFTSGRNLTATSSHRFVFSGDKRQQIDIAPSCYFATVELQNHSEEGVYATTMFGRSKLIRNGCRLTYGNVPGEFGWTLQGDQIYEGDLILMEDTLDLNGYTLMVTGDFIQPSGSVNVNGGQLIVQGDYRMQTRNGEEGSYTYSSSTGRLIMQNATDKVTVKGQFVMNTSVSTDGLLTAGLLELQGNFLQSGGSAYIASGSNTILFTGKKNQTWSHTTAPTVANVINRSMRRLTLATTPTVTGTVTDEKGNILGSGCIKVASLNQIAGGSYSAAVQVTGQDTLEQDIKVATLTLAEGASLNAGKQQIEAESVTLNGSLYVENSHIACTNHMLVNTNGQLIMQGAGGDVLVGGDFTMSSKFDHSDSLTEGILEIRGHFDQNSYINFIATKNHTVILSRKLTTTGKNFVQSVAFNYKPGTTRFNKLILRKNQEGYDFKNDLSTIANEVIYEVEDEVPPTGVKYINAVNTTVTSVTLSYGGAEDPSGILGYEIYRDGVQVAVTGDTTYTDTGLEPAKEYTYTVYPFDNFRNLAEESPEMVALTKEDTEAPTAPDGLSVYTRTGSSITLAWNAATDNANVVEYAVYRNGVMVASKLKETTYKDMGLTTNTVYRYQVVAKDLSGNASNKSKMLESVVAMPEIMEVSPADYSGIGGDNMELMVKFKNVGNASGNRVKMEYRKEGGEWQLLSPAMLGQKVYNSTSLYVNYSWNITGLNGTYDVRYTLYDADRNTDVKEVTYLIDREAPKKPEEVEAVTCDGIVQVTWEASKSGDCTYYKLYRKEEGESKYNQLAKLSDRFQTTYQDDSVEIGKTYTYALVAGDAFYNESEYTTAVTVEVDEDRAVPEVVDISPRAGRIGQITNVMVTAEDNRGVASIRLQCRDEKSEEWKDLSEVETVNNVSTYAWDTASLTDGIYILRAVAVDTSGNESVQEFTRRYEIDNTGISKIEITKYTAASTGVSLHWADVKESDFAYFQVEMLTGNDFIKVGTTSDMLGYQVGQLAPNKEYTFRVVGYDNLGNRGIPSDEVKVTTIEDEIAPVITAVYPISSCYKDKLALQVRAQDNYAVQKAVFSYSTDKVNYTKIAEVQAGTPAANTTISKDFDISHLPEGSIYVKFEVYDTYGNKNALLATGEDIITEYVIDRTPPARVEGVKAVGTQGYVELNWNSEMAQDIRAYKIYRANAQTGIFTEIQSACNSRNHYDTNVETGETYIYKIAAIDLAGNVGETSEECYATVVADTQIPVITGMSPASGKVVGMNPTIKVLAVDNAGLESVTLEYLAADSEQEIWTRMAEATTADRSFLWETKWDTSELEEGEYHIRAIAKDMAGNVSTIYQVTYTLDKTAPEAPVLTAETGHFRVKLKVSGEKGEDFSHYALYRRVIGEEDFVLLRETALTAFEDTKAVPNTMYSYKIAAYDKCGNVSWSQEVDAYADDLDIIPPTVVLPENLIGLEGMELAFDGMGSRDNVRVTDYVWHMGNGDVITGAQPVYTYDKAGTYVVTLEVSDAAGNKAHGNTTVRIYEKDGRGITKVQVVDEAGTAIPYALVYVEMANGENMSLKADGNGYVTIAATLGVHKVAAYATNYLPDDIQVTISEFATNAYTLTLVKDELIVGDLTVRRMTMEEMVEAGVDFSAPENYNRFVFNLTLTFKESPVPVNVQFVGGESNHEWHEVEWNAGEGSFTPNTPGNSHIYLKPVERERTEGEEVTEEVPVLVYVRTTQSIEWLKEMFEVELGILNAADSEYVIEDSTATLHLPQRVSLAATKSGQSLMQSMGDIRGQERKSVTWVIRGDESGSYKLSADFEGTLMPFATKVRATFETEEEFHVSTGEGIHIYVMPEDSAYHGENYYIQFAVANESDRIIYNLGTSFGPYTAPDCEYTVTDIHTGEVYTERQESVVVSDPGSMSQSVVVRDGQKLTFSALAPGEVYYGTYVTGFSGTGTEDVYYQLVDSLVETLTGENTGVQVHVVPISGHIYRSYWGVEEVPGLYGDPIDMASGYFADEMTAFSINGAVPLTLDMRYASGLTEGKGVLGYCWYHDYEMYLEQRNGILYFHASPHNAVSFINQNALNRNLYCSAKGEQIILAEGEQYSYGEYISISSGMRDVKLVRNQDGTYTMTYTNGTEYHFDASGRLTRIRDTEGKTVSLIHEGSRITIREDLSGKRMYLDHDASGRLVSISDDNNRQTVITYDEADRMSTLTSPAGVTITYTYDEKNRILTEANAQGVFVANVYDEADRVVKQTDATGGVETLSYEGREDGGMTVRITDARGASKQAVVDAHGRIIKVVNENGGTTEYTYNSLGNVVCEKDSYGNCIFKEYDSKGNLVKMTDTGNLTTTMTYDSRGNVVTITNPDGQRAEYTYNEGNRVIRAKDFNGAVTEYAYDGAGQLIRQTTEGLGAMTYTYESGMPVSVTDYKGNTTYSSYDGAGNLIKTVDALGNVTTYAYDSVGHMLSATDSLGNTTRYTYDCNGNITSMTDAVGNVTAYTYDPAGRQTAVTYPDGTITKYEYDGMGNNTAVLFADGTQNTYTYDASGNVVKETLADGTELTYTYDLLNRRVSETDKKGRTVKYEYYPNGNPYKITYPDGTYELYTYNNRWKVASVKDTAGYVTSYEYDAMGNVTQERDALGNAYSYTYDTFGRVIKTTDPNGNSTTYAYDANGNCIRTTDALGNSVYMEYDALNRMTRAYRKDKAGVEYSIHYTYDALGRVSSVTDELGNVNTMTYDKAGNVISVTDANGVTTSASTYDTMGRVTSTKDALGLTTTYTYDKLGNLLQTVEKLNGQAERVTSYEYDTLGRVTKVTDPLAGGTWACYDESGNVKSITDANGGTTTYSYDQMDRLLEEMNPIGSRYRYTYNAQGLLSELQNARGQKTTYTYDAIGRVTSMTDELGMVSYTYDGNGNVLTVTDKQGTISRSYDALNRVTQYTDYKGNTVKYGYDELGNLISLTYPGGEIVRYTYYKNGLLKTATDGNGQTTAYEYDAGGNLTRTTRPNGTEELCTYNKAGLLVEQKDVKGEEVLTHYIYTYDGYGNVTTIEGTETTDTEEGISNLVSATMTYDEANRLVTYNGETLRYDADGNMTYGPVDGVMSELVYDCRNRLVSAGGITYTYDAENIRIKAETADYVEEYVTDTVSASLSRVLTMTVYEKKSGVTETNGTTTTYLYGQGLISEETEGTYLYHHYNNLGSTMKLTDNEGQVVETYTYGVYGELLSGDETLTHFLYNGRCGVSTEANGLYYMRQRYYNPQIKRFINQDILTGSLDNSQSLNRYSYVQGNPVSYTDPFGLSPVNGLFSNTNNIHTTLTVLGFTPGPGGVVADLLDAGIYLVEGDLSGTALAFLAVFCGSAALTGKAAKAGKVMNKANKLSNTSQLVNRASDMMSTGNSFMRAAMNGSDVTQVVKTARQGRVIDKLKSAVTSAANKLNPKTISKVELDDHIRLVSQGTPSGSMRYNLQFFGGGSTKGKGIKTSFGKTSGKAYQSGNSSIQLSAGKNVKSHYKDHKGLLEAVLNKDYPKFKDSNNAEEFLNDLSEMINNGTLKYAYKSTAQKGGDILNIYIGKGLVLATKQNDEWVTLLEAGKGMAIQFEIFKILGN